MITSVCKVLGLSKDNRSIQVLDYSFKVYSFTIKIDHFELIYKKKYINQIKELSRALMDIAYALNHSKDMRDLFYDLEEKVY